MVSKKRPKIWISNNGAPVFTRRDRSRGSFGMGVNDARTDARSVQKRNLRYRSRSLGVVYTPSLRTTERDSKSEIG